MRSFEPKGLLRVWQTLRKVITQKNPASLERAHRKLNLPRYSTNERRALRRQSLSRAKRSYKQVPPQKKLTEKPPLPMRNWSAFSNCRLRMSHLSRLTIPLNRIFLLFQMLLWSKTQSVNVAVGTASHKMSFEESIPANSSAPDALVNSIRR